MDLNFALENYVVIILGLFLGMGMLSIIGITFFGGVFKAVHDIPSVVIKEKKISADVRESLLIGLGFSLIVFGSYQGVNYLKGLKDNMEREVSVDSNYQVRIIKQGGLLLSKKILVDRRKLETTQVNGIEIEKIVLVKEEQSEAVLNINCGKLSFDECLVKTRESLSVITAGNNETMKVVQF